MGEIAEMMLDGTLCAGCGEYLPGDADGFPVYCAACRVDFGDESPAVTGKPRKAHNKVQCPDCGKRVTDVGLQQHIRDSHGVTTAKLGRVLSALKLILPLAKGYNPEGQSVQARETCQGWILAAEQAIEDAEKLA